MNYLLSLALLTLTLSVTTHKDLNEFGKWKKFHNIFETEFRQSGSAIELDIVSYDYDLSKEFLAPFNQFFIFSKDSSKFIDLDTYSLVLEKDDSGNLFSTGSGVDIKVQVVNRINNEAMSVLFCGTDCYPETALWRNNNWLEVYGFELNENNKFVPTMWKFLIDNMIFSKFQTDKTFNSMPKSYAEFIRLEKIEFKK
jgi:hypothetical protein